MKTILLLPILFLVACGSSDEASQSSLTARLVETYRLKDMVVIDNPTKDCAPSMALDLLMDQENLVITDENAPVQILTPNDERYRTNLIEYTDSYRGDYNVRAFKMETVKFKNTTTAGEIITLETETFEVQMRHLHENKPSIATVEINCKILEFVVFE